ncbi:DUF637 domain-containing protein [Halomonas denitrificans]|uniref:DUF637 domain-containing protein n=1 Tax=Halomonas denitrificans TaxID=370769 RepID=UPI001C99954E|nr:DUF637 domain-containing protein [Halomonas denitrificans]MBY5967671.1 DUF637 domain-containing protein [Halomonas denitrificans]
MAATAALTGMASNAAVSTINHQGDLGEVWDDVTSSDALRGYAVAGVTAGLTSGLYDGWTGTQTGTTTGFPNSGTVTGAPLGTWQGAGQFGANQLLQNTTSALLDRALGGDAELGDALQASLANTFAAAGFDAIGTATQGRPNFADGSLNKAALHAVMGGLAAEAAGGDFTTGALTAVQAENFSVGDITPSAWGEAMDLRISRQGEMRGASDDWAERFPNGSIYDPRVME